MDNITKDLYAEKKMLLQSYEMYKNTRNEMLAHNSSLALIKNIDKEMESITEKIKSIDERLAALESEAMADEYVDIIKEQNTYKMNGVLPIEFNPLRNNHFIVRFPSEFGISPYMVDSVVFDAQNLMVLIRETEGKYPILPIKLKDIAQADPFTLDIDILNADGSIYYTIEYKNCSLEILNIPYLAYSDSNVRSWQVNIVYESEEYLTALPKICSNETTNQKSQ